MLHFARVLGVAVLLLVMTAASAHAQVTDHLKCYKIKDQNNVKGIVDLDSPQWFGLEQGCKVGPAKMLCVPASKTVTSLEVNGDPATPLPLQGPPAEDARVCYKVKCPPHALFSPLVTDQFGTRSVSPTKAFMLCTPAVKGTEFCGDGVKNGSEQCDGADAALCGGGCLANCLCHWWDNGDGTVTDNVTKLQWEKKTGTFDATYPICPGGGPTCSDPNDVNNVYGWSASGTAPDGALFTDFLIAINGCTYSGGNLTGGFAGHCDWRVPNIAELDTILDQTTPQCNVPACGPLSNLQCPCIDPVFGPTASSFYSSSTDFIGAFGSCSQSSPTCAWVVYFTTVPPGPSPGLKSTNHQYFVRAVRNGS